MTRSLRRMWCLTLLVRQRDAQSFCIKACSHCARHRTMPCAVWTLLTSCSNNSVKLYGCRNAAGKSAGKQKKRSMIHGLITSVEVYDHSHIVRYQQLNQFCFCTVDRRTRFIWKPLGLASFTRSWSAMTQAPNGLWTKWLFGNLTTPLKNTCSLGTVQHCSIGFTNISLRLCANF